MPNTKNVDPSPAKFRMEFVITAVVLVVLGIFVLIFANVVVGFIVSLLGGIFGLGSQVARDSTI